MDGGGLPSLVREIVGGTVRGSWWGHPLGGLIYELENILFDSPEVLGAKLVEGKVTFIHRSLWKPLLRIVSDPAWRKAKVAALDAPSRKLLARTERGGQLRIDTRAAKKARETLSGAMLALSYNVHTESGNHAPVMVSWDHWAPPSLRRDARKLDFDASLRAIRKTCGGTAYGLEPPGR